MIKETVGDIFVYTYRRTGKYCPILSSFDIRNH